MRKTRIAVLIGVVCGALALTGCTKSAGGNTNAAASTGKPTDGGTLTLLESEQTGGLDPAEAFADASRSVIAMTFSTLVKQDPSGKLVGSLAQSWDALNNDAEYVFHIRSGAKFSDGADITAADVVFSIERMKTSKTLGNALKAVTSVTATDPSTVDIKLNGSARNLPQALSQPGWAVVVPQKEVSADPEFFTKPSVSSGPFVLTEYIPKDHMTFTRNQNYYEKPHVATIKLTFSEDQTANAAAIQSGSADISYVNYSDAKKLKQSGFGVFQTDALNLLFFGFDKTKAPFNDVRVRQAFAYADDRDGKQTACWYDTGAVSYGSLLRPWDPDYTEIDTYKLSRDDADAKAAALLDSAGWKLNSSGQRVATGVPGVADGTPLKLTVPYESNWSAAQCHTLVLQQSLKKVGVDITPQAYDPTTFYTQAGKGAFTMWHGGAGAQNADDLYANWFHTGGSLTAVTTQVSDPAIDKQIDEAGATTDLSQAKTIYGQLEQWQAQNVPMLVDGYQWAETAVGPRVHGFAAGWLDDPTPLINLWVS